MYTHHPYTPSTSTSYLHIIHTLAGPLYLYPTFYTQLIHPFVHSTPLLLLTRSNHTDPYTARTVNAMHVSCISYPSYTFYASYPFYQQRLTNWLWPYLLVYMCCCSCFCLLLLMLLLMCRFTVPMQRCGTELLLLVLWVAATRDTSLFIVCKSASIVQSIHS